MKYIFPSSIRAFYSNFTQIIDNASNARAEHVIGLVTLGRNIKRNR